jgi:flagellar biosynthesis protein FlhF
VLAAVENALLGTKVELSRPGDPALPVLCQRVLQALIRTEARFEAMPAAAELQTQVLVGPTGVGKTTTLAKLASRAVHQGQRVAIVTLDTYRVAAVEQLRAFADLLDVPLEVAFTPQDLRRALQTHCHCDRIFVDTTGKSPLDRDALGTLHGTLGNKATTLLCLAAATRRRDSELILEAYESLGVAAAVLTKWDETLVPGEALSVLIERGLPLSHVTIGQEVPADILAADPAQLAAAAFDLETRRAEASA